MELIWYAVFTLLLSGYFALEGFDLGVGLLMPVIGRTQETRDRMVAAMAPFVLANEVWLVAVAGALFGVYPHLEGEALFGLYPLVVAMLLSWVVRDAGLWFRRRIDGPGWRRFWDAMITAGSLGLSFGWGVALYAATTGFGSSLLHPFGLLLGVVVTLLFAWHGWTFLGWRAPETAGITRTGRALALSALAAALPALAVLGGSLPYLLDHSAPASTLGVMGVMALPFAPVMVLAQVWVWRFFRPGRSAVRTPSFF
ncbi:cytochrome d ubiquinol oxidase subunit II [Nonomuraea sp. SMC257]|uniref:Cytochrome d ubiquinol oxidase subunit II n=1 Tax=Nonomuraea montanisoli TaxID=2741721 RepID=A0A7Y6M514_9ACTN|nr:cytochrome d ubiquinol oxidase subunit II [Nonomuraea montanisoli]NUW34055.1 cytochrome d ubiquinol oxidase subunit II [Nonomuraea montanisoli]